MSYVEILTPCKSQAGLMESHRVTDEGRLCTCLGKKNTRPAQWGKINPSGSTNTTPSQNKLQC